MAKAGNPAAAAMPKEAREIDMGIFRGGAKIRERSISSEDFEMEEPPKKNPKKPASTKQYKRKSVKRLKTTAF